MPSLRGGWSLSICGGVGSAGCSRFSIGGDLRSNPDLGSSEGATNGFSLSGFLSASGTVRLAGGPGFSLGTALRSGSDLRCSAGATDGFGLLLGSFFPG